VYASGGRRIMRTPKIELYNDHFQNFKRYNIPKAQLIIADIPYNLGNNAYASSPQWYIDGDNKNGESSKANKEFFDTDKDFRIAEYMHFCTQMMRPEPKEAGKAPCMIIFCAFEQISMVIEYGIKHGFKRNIPLFFIKNYSGQVLKANMRIAGATEHAIILYRDKLPKFNNEGRMIFNWMNWERDNAPKIHPTQKPNAILKRLVQIFTDVGDTVIDPVAGSAATLRACAELNRDCYGFEIKKEFVKKAKEIMLNNVQRDMFAEVESSDKYRTEKLFWNGREG
jgi:site-specific DNA-methyltransferase (adenine-specific)